MQGGREQDGYVSGSMFGRWRDRLAQTLLREPAVVLIDRDADGLSPLPEPRYRPKR